MNVPLFRVYLGDLCVSAGVACFDTMEEVLRATNGGHLPKWGGRLMWDDLEDWAIYPDGTLVLIDECGNAAFPPEGMFRVEWHMAAVDKGVLRA